MAQYETGVWYSWGEDGDKDSRFPVPAGTLVAVRHRDGEIHPGICVGQDEAEDWSVDETNAHDGDIMAFMVEED